MRPLTSLRSAVAGVLAAALVLFPPTSLAKSDGPTITSTDFERRLDNIFYFDDSNVILAHDKDDATVWRSNNAGKSWNKVDDQGQAQKSWELYSHPYDNQRAYILGLDGVQWLTTDQGESWRSFKPGSDAAYGAAPPLNFHGRDPKRVIWNGEDCVGLSCAEVAMYTLDDFETVHKLGDGMRGCYWAVGTPMFAEVIDVEVTNRMFCIQEGLYSSSPKDNRLTVSDDFFKNEEIEPALDSGRAVSGVISMAAVKKYLVAAAKSAGTDELALYVTDDSSDWHRAEFGQHRVAEDAYTVLESTNYSMQVDVLGTRLTNPMGHLFTSNSNGTFFTKNLDYTNRNFLGRVDFEKVQNIQGIVLANIVENGETVAKNHLTEKRIVSQISFDDGRKFQKLKLKKKDLHLHSVTDAIQDGRIFSSPAPGIIMGIGNTGPSLKTLEDSDLYVSDDAGVTWREALNGPHYYEFGNDGAVLMAAPARGLADYVQYSLNHGKDWTKASLEKKISVKFLTTVPDSTTLQFLVGGTTKSGSEQVFVVYKVDFAGLHERSCKDSDFEKWPARVDADGNPSCIMGHKQYYRRRKADADCVIEADFKDPVPEFEPCVCTQMDFECDYDFVRDPNDSIKCNPIGPLPVPEGACTKESDTFTGPSGWRLIPGNACKRDGGVPLDKDIQRPCADTIRKPATDTIAVEKTTFNADTFREWYYLERSTTSLGSDETVIMRTGQNDVYISRDHGKKWEPILKGEHILAILPNPYFKDTVYFVTGTKTVHYTIDRGENLDQFTAKEPPSISAMNQGLPPVKFHPTYRSWMLWSGSSKGDGQTDIYYTTDRGDEWATLARASRRCEFIDGKDNKKLVFCEQHQDENPSKPLELKSSDNWFASSETHFSNILDFATMAEFIIVAAKNDDQRSLKVDASLDGHTFAAAKWPNNFNVKQEQAYTVLDSSTHAVFLHVTTNPAVDREYGTILKSNSNGTSYVLMLNAVNRNTNGFVDFEKMQGLEGVALVNTVANSVEVGKGAMKTLRSAITHNDGAEWRLLPPPKKDALGNDYSCVRSEGEPTEDCSLHIHSYTERIDKSATFSSASAVGLMMAVGNVGEHLVRKDDDSTDTFITRDAGITWKSVKKGSYMWEYGDQGSIIVIVLEHKPTRSVFYTLDEGDTWTEFEFSDTDMLIDAITTLPSDTSRNFLLWGAEVGQRAKIVTVNLDFSGLKDRQRQCELDEGNPLAGDYELWSPRHPTLDDDCLFGHKAQYHRKKREAKCYNGRTINHLHSIEYNCSCTRADFECDYNYQTHSENDRTCALVEGTEEPDHSAICREKPGTKEYYKPTGYRKLVISTCQGGREYDKAEAVPCPGYEEEFRQKHRISGIGLFFAITIPILAAIGFGYWVWTQWQNGSLAGFGQIRLGESIGATGSRLSGGSGGSPFIAVPVAIISGVVAVVKAVPLLITSLFRSARGYVPLGRNNGYGGNTYRSRGSFARSRTVGGDAYIEDDELLGEDDDADDV